MRKKIITLKTGQYKVMYDVNFAIKINLKLVILQNSAQKRYIVHACNSRSS